jgi:hypothetical protein
VQPVQLSLIPDPLPATTADPPAAPMVEQPPTIAVTTAITLLATVIAKAATPNGIEVTGDE